MRKGFTLIELLIVVAIIAILAAIAVPNFLEAQVRAKVSRAKSDMRTLNTAIESYRVDNNAYPVCHTFSTSGVPPGEPQPYVLEILSSPVSYISNAVLPNAFFAPKRISNATAAGTSSTPVSAWIDTDSDPIYQSYFYVCGSNLDRVAWVAGSATAIVPQGQNCTNALFHSPGPSQVYFNLGGIMANGSGAGISGNQFGDCLSLVYDPTNGTTSFGALWRAMGETSFYGQQMYAAVQTAAR